MWLCLSAICVMAWIVLLQAPAANLVGFLCSSGTASRLPEIFTMWLAMACAMMLPSAAPMLSVYMDIAEAARAKSIAVVSPFILVAGYVSVWLGFSVAAAGLQRAISIWQAPVWVAGLVLVFAGLYQFAPLKHACLSKCRHPLPFFMAHWSERTSDVFRIGLSQGLHCLGCCWALMLLGFVSGLMNLLWMAAVGVLMILEKTLPQPKPLVYGLGLGLIGAGAALALHG